MTETWGLALVAGLLVVIALQVTLLLRGNHRTADELRLRALQESQDKGLARLERELREELARGRREDAEESFRDREERAQSSTLLGQAVTTQVTQLGALQAERLEAFARELNRFSLGLDERFERLKMAVESRLTAIQADNAKKLEDLMTSLDGQPLLVHCASSNRVGALRALTASAHGEALESAIATGKTWGLTGLEPAVRTKLSQ